MNDIFPWHFPRYLVDKKKNKSSKWKVGGEEEGEGRGGELEHN